MVGGLALLLVVIERTGGVTIGLALLTVALTYLLPRQVRAEDPRSSDSTDPDADHTMGALALESSNRVTVGPPDRSTSGLVVLPDPE